jgi:hypothetical protein
MGWKSMQRYLPQVAEVTRIFGDTLADQVEKRHPKLGPIARGGLKAIETIADEAGDNITASLPATSSQYTQPQMPFPPQQDPALEQLLSEQYYREQLTAEGAPNSYSAMYGEGGAGQER